MNVTPDSVTQERVNEARLDDELAAGAEKAATMLQNRDQTIQEKDQRIRELESRDAEIAGVMSEGSAARAGRMSRKQQALDALKKAGVVVAVIAIVVGGLYAANKFGSVGEQYAGGEPGTPGFQHSLTLS